MRYGVTITILVALATLSQVAAQSDSELEQLLDGLAAVAVMYQDNALGFTCDEIIHHHSDEGRKDYKFTYIYINGDEGLVDYRVKYGSAGKKKAPTPIDLSTYRLPAALFRAYSWIFVFREDRRDRYRFELIGEETMHARPALKLRFAPIPPFQHAVNEFFGTAWIDTETLQLLRVEAVHHRDRKRQEWLQREWEQPSNDARLPIAIETVETDFRFFKQGLRFPSEVLLRKTAYRISEGPSDIGRQIYKVRQKYRNYQFYDVDTTDKVYKAKDKAASP